MIHFNIILRECVVTNSNYFIISFNRVKIILARRFGAAVRLSFVEQHWNPSAGVATDSITEDFLTSIRLNAEGWKIRYHHEALAFGIAPQSLSAFLMQRLRWAQGGMKILRSRDNPLIKKGLSFKQRMSHFAAIFTYFDAYQKLIYL